MISAVSPMRNSTFDSRRWSSSIVPASLKSGTTIESVILSGLRGTAETPAHGRREIVTNKGETFTGHEGVRLGIDEQRDFSGARLDQASRHTAKGIVDITRVDHQLDGARLDTVQQASQRSLIE